MCERIIGSLTTLARALRLLRHLAKGLLTVAVLFPYCKPRERDGIIAQWSFDCLRILNVHVRIKGERPPSGATSIFFVANHVSWIDILALNAIKPVRFVAKSEVRSWPLVGWMAARAGTLFLTRARPRQLIRVNRSLRAALKRGQCVALFPEGTTSDGRSVLSFRSGLLESAVASHALVWPVALRYHGADGKPSDSAAFIGEQSLMDSMHQVLSLPALHLDLHFLRILPASQYDRHELAHRTRSAILSALQTGPAPSLSSARWGSSLGDRPDEAAATT